MFKTRIKGRPAQGAFFGVVLLLLVGHMLLRPASPPQVVQAASAHLFHPGQGTATIDGNIGSTEWATADLYSLPMVGSDLTGTLYVMQDSTHLFLGFVIDDDELSTGYWYGLYGDTLEFEFDDNNSGALFEIGENKATIFATAPWYYDLHFYNITGSSQLDTSQSGGTTNGSGLSSRQGSDNHYELAFPLCSGDGYDFCVNLGQTIGLRLKYNDIYPDGGGYSATTSLYPGLLNTDMVTIDLMAAGLLYLPLINK